MTRLPLRARNDVRLVQSARRSHRSYPACLLQERSGNRQFPSLDLQDAIGSLLVGNVGGSLGATSGIAILLGAIFLLYKALSASARPSPLSGAFSCCLGFSTGPATFINGSVHCSPVSSVRRRRHARGFLPGGRSRYSPMTPWGRILFGIGCGVITFLIRKYGGYADGVCWPFC